MGIWEGFMETATRAKLAEIARERGLIWTAKYMEMFPGSWCPAFFQGANKETEAFYKMCVEEGQPWDWLIELPEDVDY